MCELYTSAPWFVAHDGLTLGQNGCNDFGQTKSTTPRKSAITTTNNKTAELVLMVSCLSGQTTFFSSTFACSKNTRNLQSSA
jgi:hypothetical protein